MSKEKQKNSAIGQVEFAISRLDRLSILPCVGAKFLAAMLNPSIANRETEKIIESDPGLACMVFKLMYEHGISFAEEHFSIRRAIGKLGENVIGDSFFSMPITDLANEQAKKELLIHSIAVGCCAGNIAERITPKMDAKLAFTAGLLHDIGKLALCDTMPKSFDRIVEAAKSKNASSCEIEKEYLGVDHTILGKRLGQSWHLPMQVAFGIWLHHSDTAAIAQTVPQARISCIVQLADLIVRGEGLGESGSYDPTETGDLAGAMGIMPGQLEEIRDSLAEAVEQKSETLGLNMPEAMAAYNKSIRDAAAKFAVENTQLSKRSIELGATSGQLEFITDLLSDIEDDSPPILIAKRLGVLLQRLYQAGPVCIYLAPTGASDAVEAAVIENADNAEMLCLYLPADSEAIPAAIAKDFSVLAACDYVDWVFEQLEIDFDLSRTKIAPVLYRDKAVGAIVFESRYPIADDKLRDDMETTLALAGAILDMVLTGKKEQVLAEQFAGLLSASKTKTQAPTKQIAPPTENVAGDNDPPGDLAELAAGAGHELNNPLVLISGKAQLLDEAETDPAKKEILRQINANANKASAIIDGLMSYADPAKPKRFKTKIGQIIAEAVLLTRQKTMAENLNIQIDLTYGDREVFVDSAQVASSIAQILSNAIESYGQRPGAVKISGVEGGTDHTVIIQIVDLGCGMDEETIKKATLPFFSAKPAGRKTGMGLAYANRLINLNAGALKIESEPGAGTTVTVALPCE